MPCFILTFLAFLALSIISIPSLAKHKSPRKDSSPTFSQAQTILVQATVVQKGNDIAADPITDVVRNRLNQIGYDTITHVSAPHDVIVTATCEEPSPENDVQVPPCVLTYALQGQTIDWRHVDRIVFSDGVTAIQRALTKPLKPGPVAQSIRFLECYDFPLLFAAEWRQIHRLLALLDHPDTDWPRQIKILSLFGEIHAESVFSRLVTALEDPALIQASLSALGNYGQRAQPYLLHTLKTSSSPRLQATAVHSLGQVGAATGDTSITPVLLDILTAPETDIVLKTEIVWALGKAPDFRSFPALAKLEHTVWSIRSHDIHLQKLREAIDWSIREVRQGGHTDDY